jgi:hypothetical protein
MDTCAATIVWECRVVSRDRCKSETAYIIFRPRNINTKDHKARIPAFRSKNIIGSTDHALKVRLLNHVFFLESGQSVSCRVSRLSCSPQPNLRTSAHQHTAPVQPYVDKTDKNNPKRQNLIWYRQSISRLRSDTPPVGDLAKAWGMHWPHPNLG